MYCECVEQSHYNVIECLAVGAFPRANRRTWPRHVGIKLTTRLNPVKRLLCYLRGGKLRIGDVIRGPDAGSQGPKKKKEAIDVSKGIVTGTVGHVNYDAIPAVVYTQTKSLESENRRQFEGIGRGIYRRENIPFLANGAPARSGQTEGRSTSGRCEGREPAFRRAHHRPRAGDSCAEAAVAIASPQQRRSGPLLPCASDAGGTLREARPRR